MSLLGIRLRALRKEKKVLAKQLALIIGVHASAITNWEKGNRIPNVSVLIELANYFDCSVDFLVGSSNYRTNKIYYNQKYNSTFKIDIDKNHSYYLNPKEVESMVKQLDSIGLDIDKLITTSKKNCVRNEL